jgi:hypothetical protein
MRLNIHSISRVTGPTQCPESNKVHMVTLSSPCPGVSSGDIMVEAMGSDETAVAIAQRLNSMFPESPAQTTGSLPSMEVTGKRIQPPSPEGV